MKMLWFVSENGYPVSVFDNKDDAIIEKDVLASIDVMYTYRIYGISHQERMNSSLPRK